MRALLCAALTASFALSCSAKEDVSLVVSARNASLAKLPSAFDAKLAGAVDVSFDLGAYSGAPVQVDAIQLGLYRGNAQILTSAKLEPEAGTVFPLSLAPGAQRVIHYTVAQPQLSKDEQTTLCAGPVTITGAVKQSGKPDLVVHADPVTPTGCP